MLQQLPKRPFQLPPPPLLSALKTLKIPRRRRPFLRLTTSSNTPKTTSNSATSSSLLPAPGLSQRVSNSMPTSSNQDFNPFLSSLTTSSISLPLRTLHMFDESPHKLATTWISAISSLAENELPLIALLELFCRMLGEGLRADDHIYPCATKSIAILGRIDAARCVHGLVVKTGIEYDVFMGSYTVDMYAKCREIRDARKMFDEVPEKNVVSWTGMISGSVLLGEDKEALRLFE